MDVYGQKTDTNAELASLDKLCELCEVDNINTQASGFCKECEENMCNACFRQHLRVKSCKQHTLLDTNSSVETYVRSNARAVKCKQHVAESVKYYCRTHEAVGCGDCLVSKHGGCNTEFIKNVSENFSRKEDYKTLMKTFENRISETKECEMKIQEYKKNNNVMLEKALRDIKQFRLNINKHLDKVEADIICQVKNVTKENEIVLTKLENDCSMLSTKLEEITAMLNSELYKDNVLFIHALECKQKLNESENAISDMKSKSIKQYEFGFDQQLYSLVTTPQKLGTLVISTSAVFPETTDRAIEKSKSQGYAYDESRQRRMENQKDNVEGRCTTEITEGENEQTSRNTEHEVKSLVDVGARVIYNGSSRVALEGTITEVHEDCEVTVKWNFGTATRHKVGVGEYDVSLIYTSLHTLTDIKL